MKIEELAKIAKSIRGKSGGGCLIQLEGAKAYLVNSKRSLAVVIDSKGLLDTPIPIGTGTFHSNDLDPKAKKIERRDGMVWFDDKGIPEKPPFANKVEEVMGKYYVEPTIKIPKTLFECLEDQLVVTLRGEGDRLKVQQLGNEKWVEVEGKAEGEVTVYTSDLEFLKNFEDVRISLSEPMSFKAKHQLDEVRGLIAHLVYER